jgi:phosphonate transport system substrate-binding protein
MEVLRLASCMAENTEGFCRALAAHIHDQLGVEVKYVDDKPWQEREKLFDQGNIQVLWICGLPYIDKVKSSHSRIELLAVPVFNGPLYGGRPVYFSDVIVRRESRIKKFTDLRDSIWAYNKPRSHSGFNVVRAHLANLGKKQFFRRVVESGSHSASLDLVLKGTVDASAIDSTVLEWAISQRPQIANEIRTVAVLGPSPIPPWVVSKELPENFRVNLRSVLLGMHQGPAGRRILAYGCLERFVPAEDRDFDPIRRMAEAAEQVCLPDELR